MVSAPLQPVPEPPVEPKPVHPVPAVQPPMQPLCAQATMQPLAAQSSQPAKPLVAAELVQHVPALVASSQASPGDLVEQASLAAGSAGPKRDDVELPQDIVDMIQIGGALPGMPVPPPPPEVREPEPQQKVNTSTHRSIAEQVHAE